MSLYQPTAMDLIYIALIAVLAVGYFLTGVDPRVGTDFDGRQYWVFRLGIDDVAVQPVDYALNEVLIRIYLPTSPMPRFLIGDHVIIEEGDSHLIRYRIKGITPVTANVVELRCGMVAMK